MEILEKTFYILYKKGAGFRTVKPDDYSSINNARLFMNKTTAILHQLEGDIIIECPYKLDITTVVEQVLRE